MLGSVDFNLLRPLNALLDERSVTRAAERLRVSQPTASVALSRLRQHFGDPLLVRSGSGFVLTPLGDRLHKSLPVVLAQIDRFFTMDSEFEPAESRHEFVIAGVDYAMARIGAPLARAIGREAPGVQISLPALRPEQVQTAPDSLRSIDGLILPHGYILDQPHIDVGTDDWVCVVDGDSDLDDQPSADDLLARPWVHTLDAREGMTPARQQMQLLGVEVHVTVITPSFYVVPALIAGTDRVALLPRTLASTMAATDVGIRVVASPFGLAPIRDAFWWHAEREFEPEHVWLRAMLGAVALQLSITNSD